MRIPGVGRLKAQGSRFWGQLAPGPLVLCWHRVAHLHQDPYLLAVTPEHCDEQLRALRDRYQVVSLADLTRGLAGRRGLGPVVALTFDDGYADNATTAFPLLRKHGMPATFYLSSGYVGTTREYLQDELERLLLASPHYPDELHLTVAGKSFAWDLRSRDALREAAVSEPKWDITSKIDPTPRHRALREIHNLLRVSRPVERDRALDQLRSQCGDLGLARPTHRPMTWGQARDMAACELVELGAHTVNHPWLSVLSAAEQRSEIVASRRTLEAQIARPVVSFAYPYGTRESYTMETVSVVNEAGFTNACSTFRARIGGRSDLFQFPRLVVRDWDGDEFLRRLKAGRL